MTYEQTLEDLYSRLPMFSRIGAAAYKEDLHNTLALCEALGNPHHTFKSIHIAGTNGKGSTSHMLAAVLQEAGYKTGLYTSPHLKDFGERIRVNGAMILQDFVVDFAARTKGLCDAIEPSFFELTVAMAFDYFATEQVDIAVIETGLGGRLDSTNVITPVLSIITNIGYDHMHILGNTLEAIAAEKAGIIKPKVPVVIGEYTAATQPVFINKARSVNAPIYFAQDDCTTRISSSDAQTLTVELTDKYTRHSLTCILDLNGLYQSKNLRNVWMAVKLLQQAGFDIKEASLLQALAHVKPLTGLHGRWDVIDDQPTIILDVAHNEDGIRQVLEQIEHAVPAKKEKQLHFIIGLVRDKDADKVLALLPKQATYYFTQAHIPRALPFEELQEKAAAHGLSGTGYADVNTALETAKKKAAPDDWIIVCGSVFLVGEVIY